MNLKTWCVGAVALLLVGCFPAKEITSDNAQSIVTASRHLNAVSTHTQTGFSARINNQSLERLLVRTNASPISGSCARDNGTFLFSLSADGTGISLVFDQCETDDQSVLNGTVNGTVNETEESLSVSLQGDLDVRSGTQSIRLNPIELTLDLSLNSTDMSVYMTHSGTYQFDTEGFKGTVSVETKQAVGCNLTTSNCSGEVVYSDTKGNRLSVEHDNNGVHLYLNGTFLKTYSHGEWSSLTQA